VKRDLGWAAGATRYHLVTTVDARVRKAACGWRSAALVGFRYRVPAGEVECAAFVRAFHATRRAA
jgi:hypothetical protein